MSAVKPPRPNFTHQAAAVPYLLRGKKLKFCLIKSTAGRWKFPKGLIDPGETFEQTALKEAHEEAGLRGRIIAGPLGCYEIIKEEEPLTVIAVLMEVIKVEATWKENSWRERRWASPAKARKLISEPVIQELLDWAIERIAANRGGGPANQTI